MMQILQVFNVEPTQALDTRSQDGQRLIDLEGTTKIDTIEPALRALGKELVIDARKAIA
jgi:hypothetical protein